RGDPERDRALAAGVLTTVAAVLVAAVIAAVGQHVLIGKMQSQKLAAIAAAGVVALAAAPAAAIALCLLPPLQRLARALPRPRALGTTGLLLLALVAAGAAAGALALSRADWRVLDLGPLAAVGAAAVLGAGHAIFWYGLPAGR